MKNKVPKLRFPEFSGEWEEKKLGDLVLINTGKKDTQNKIENGKYPFFVRSQIIERIDSYSFDGEAILTAGDGVGVGKVFHYINGKFDYHQRVYKLSHFNKISGRYLFEYFSNNFIKEVTKYTAKTSVDSVRMEMLTKMLIPITSLPEQEKIASFLSEVDTKIEKLEKKKELLSQYKKGMMQKLFSQKLRFKDENGNDYPEWEEKKLGEISTLITKGTTPKKFNENLFDKIKYIKIESLTNNKINNENCLFINKSTHEIELKRSILQENDLLFAIAGSLGKNAIVKKENLPANTNQALAIIRLNNNQNYIFILQLLNSNLMEKYILENVSVGAQPNLNLQQVNNFKFYYPSLPEQEKIANFLSSIDRKVELVETKLEKNKEFKKGLLQQMFV